MLAAERRKKLESFAFDRSTLTIDPGSKGLAWAEWQGPLLFTAGLSRTGAAPIEERALEHAETFGSEGYDIVVVERMTHYPNAKARDAKANDLLDLQMIGAVVAGRVLRPDGALLFVRPQEWKGAVPKDVMGERIMAALSVSEKSRVKDTLKDIPKSLQHNVLDAIGIGLWFFKRMSR